MASPAAGPSTPAPLPTYESVQRPPFRPVESSTTPLQSYIPTFSHPVHFTRQNFFLALKDLTLHPERNSSLILRADPLPARDPTDDEEVIALGLDRHEEIRVKLLPKQVKRDGKLDQRVSLYEDESGRGVVVMAPEVREVGEVPFYHPPVKKLVFLYEPLEDDGEELPMRGEVSVAYLPFERAALGLPTRSPRKRSPLAPAVPVDPQVDVPDPDVTTRTTRTCRMLLERVYKHAYGNLVGYQKRVLHDVVVDRSSFQDLYLTLKDRHRHLDSRVPNPRSSRIDDVKRHVWKVSDCSLPHDPSLPTTDISTYGAQDVAIATFLMLLWKDMYPAREAGEREWDAWGRPPGGFVDLGCGNGLLVHVLVTEGYAGSGYELRARKTWPNYPPHTRSALIEQAISFPDWFPSSLDEWTPEADCPIREGCFIIGNHSDEITPWIPLLSLLPPTPVPFLSLPCCLHTLDDAWTANSFNPPQHPHSPPGGLEKGLEEGQSRYKAYLMWLGWVGLMCGWEWEKEGLRIPSTRGWGIVGRYRWTRDEEELRKCREWALGQVQGVRDRGVFRVREREGKEKEH